MSLNDRKMWVRAVLVLWLALGWVTPATALIERLTPLSGVIDDADAICVMTIERIDPARPSMTLRGVRDLKGAAPSRQCRVLLTGDKLNHTPELLKRVGPGLKVIAFLTELDEQRMVGLAYSEGTWLQLIATRAGGEWRWTFTHCEIYLRRTFKGTTAELLETVSGVLAGTRSPPAPQPKEPPGFGDLYRPPAPDGKPPAAPGTSTSGASGATDASSRFTPARQSSDGWHALRYSEGRGERPRSPIRHRIAPVHPSMTEWVTRGTKPRTSQDSGRATRRGLRQVASQAWAWPLLGVIALPFLAPLAALLQLLFPGLLRDKWREYRVAIGVLLTQSSVMTLHWIWLRWFALRRAEWMSDLWLDRALAAIAVTGVLVALLRSRRADTSKPAPVEFLAFGTVAGCGLLWAAYRLGTQASVIDQMGVVTVAAILACGHLIHRAAGRAVNARFGTELVFLIGLAALELVLARSAPAEVATAVGAVDGEWPQFRGDARRSGATLREPRPITSPRVLWTFDPAERKGRVRMHSSPAVVGDHVYIGALHEVQSLSQGIVYCVRAVGGETNQPEGSRVWKFTAGGSLKPVFASPAISAGKLWIGEGYHQDQGCRLFGLDLLQPEVAPQVFPTSNHVESTPCVVGNSIYVGAGDEGLLCLDASPPAPVEAPRGEANEAPSGGTSLPRVRFRVPDLHVDGSPLVAEGRVYFGSVLGDNQREFAMLAVAADDGALAWRVPSPHPVTAGPAYDQGRVLFGTGLDKFGAASSSPGALWCLDAADGHTCWKADLSSGVLGSPVIAEGRVIAVSCDGDCRAYDLMTGQLQWHVELKQPVYASPVVSQGRIYLVAATGALRCLSLDGGRELWQLNELRAPDSDAYSSPTLDRGRLYVAVGGRLYCLGEAGEASP